MTYTPRNKTLINNVCMRVRENTCVRVCVIVKGSGKTERNKETTHVHGAACVLMKSGKAVNNEQCRRHPDITGSDRTTPKTSD